MAEEKEFSKIAKKLVVITGTSKGLGYYSALKLIELGYTVAGCSRNVKKMEFLNSKYKDHSFMCVDVSDAIQVQKWAELIISKYGSPSLLINNAGVAADKVRIEDAPNDVIDKIIDVNVKGVLFVTKYFMRSMKKNTECNSKIIVISSASGRNGYAEMSPYCASKWAVEGFCASVAKELPSHMMCCAYDPGSIVTEMLIYLIPELKGQIENALKMGAVGAEKWANVCIPHILSLDIKKHNGVAVERTDCEKLFHKNWAIYMKIKQQVLSSKQ